MTTNNLKQEGKVDNLVKVDGERITVSGRLLHERLGLASRYRDWFASVCEQLGLVRGEDFRENTRESTGGRPEVDHQLTTRAAKKIAARSRTVRGNDALEYLLDVEEKITARPEPPEVLVSRAIVAAGEIIKQYAAQNEKLTAEVEELKPKAQFADALTATDGCILIREMAKIITQNGYNIGQNNFFDALVKRGLLFRKHGAHREDYEPTQYAMGMGIFRIVKNVITTPSKSFASQTVKVTPKGQRYLFERFGVGSDTQIVNSNVLV
jgi:anti-repressor protein